MARYTGAPSAADRAYLRTIPRSSLPPAGDGTSAWTAIVLALASALVGGSGVLFVQRALIVERARRARRLGTEDQLRANDRLTETQNAAAAASATFVSCSSSPPLPPTAPSTSPSRLSGMPPAKIITRPLLDSWMP